MTVLYDPGVEEGNFWKPIDLSGTRVPLVRVVGSPPIFSIFIREPRVSEVTGFVGCLDLVSIVL